MQTRVVPPGRRLVLGLVMGALSAVVWGSTAWASTRLAPGIEIQAWYRMRHTFQTDTEHFDWAQWRNEGFIWLTYDNFYKNGKFFDRLSVPLPLVESAHLSARWRSRVDPVYHIREHYRHLYTESQTSKFTVPENGFRDLYADVEHGDIGPGKLYTRWGYQQIVWGESDLFRSIDIVNPLRIDQNFGVGEKFDEFRAPILAFKFLYDSRFAKFFMKPENWVICERTYQSYYRGSKSGKEKIEKENGRANGRSGCNSKCFGGK